MITPYSIQSNIARQREGSTLGAAESRLTSASYVDATFEACERASKFKTTMGVFKDRAGDMHVQRVQPNSLKYFGRNGLLFVANYSSSEQSDSVASYGG